MPQQQSSGVAKVDIYKAFNELVTQVPIGHSSTVYKYYSIYSITIPSLVSTNVIQLAGQFQVTNPFTYDIAVGWVMARGVYTGGTVFPTYVDRTHPPTVEDVFGSGTHHMPRQPMAFDTGVSGSQVYSLVIWAATLLSTTTASLTINAGYGGITALVYRQ